MQLANQELKLTCDHTLKSLPAYIQQDYSTCVIKTTVSANGHCH